MKVVIEKTYPLAATADAAWQCLKNIETVGSCMPGATITERVDASHYKGTVTVKLGPAAMSFKGNIEVLDLDEASQTLHLVGKGSDTTGTSGASMDLTASIRTSGATCELVGKSEVSMSGKAAAFGGRMMTTVADQILKQFVANFASIAQSADVRTNEPIDDATGASLAPDAAQPPQSTQPLQAPEKPSELNGLSLAWGALQDWLRRLFSRKAA
ncbi:carbon monoxide dehydrogenase subunit G [Paraburkholderia sp. GAS199]|uniref:SRPBCC family protein n=1 Tax=Paraburkholderia sp. GAS199 TaxID=3035126 RepID=UPI003D22B863